MNEALNIKRFKEMWKKEKLYEDCKTSSCGRCYGCGAQSLGCLIEYCKEIIELSEELQSKIAALERENLGQADLIHCLKAKLKEYINYAES